MVSADVQSDENVAKGKREAPMAEPSTEYLPPRLEAPYATYQPILAGSSATHGNFYQQNSFNQPQNGPSAQPYEYNRYTGVQPLHNIDSNDLGNGLHPGPPYNHQLSGGFNGNNGAPNSYGQFNKFQGSNSQENAPTYGSYNGYGQSLTVYGGNGGNGFSNQNNGGEYEYSTIKASHFGNGGSNYENSFYGSQQPINSGNPSFNSGGPSFASGNSAFNSGGPSFTSGNSGFNSESNKYPSSAPLVSNPPAYANGVKGLGHYTQTSPISNLNTQTLKNSRPLALTPSHQTRKNPPSFLTESRPQNFRPSFLLGSSVIPQQPEYNQPSLTSLGGNNQFNAPPAVPLIEQYASPHSVGALPLAQREYLPPSSAQFVNSYQNDLSQAIPLTSYGVPDTIIYTKSSLYDGNYGQQQI